MSRFLWFTVYIYLFVQVLWKIKSSSTITGFITVTYVLRDYRRQLCMVSTLISSIELFLPFIILHAW